jgi:hypothetical protein
MAYLIGGCFQSCPFSRLARKIEEHDRIHLSGVAKASQEVSSASDIFFLPEGYRPEKVETFLVLHDVPGVRDAKGVSRIDIHHQKHGGSYGWII